MSAVHGIAPRLDQIVDECSPGISPFPVSELVIAATRNWASEVALWNLALDPRGGPVQPPNHGCPTCSGVVTIDQHTHTARLTSSYFQLGQASAFVQPGAYRIKSGHFVSYRYTGPGTNVVTPGLDDVALLNPDGSRVLIAYNNSKARIRFAVKWHQHTFTYTLAPQTTATFTWHGPG
jgi:glucosylceramidase